MDIIALPYDSIAFWTKVALLIFVLAEFRTAYLVTQPSEEEYRLDESYKVVKIESRFLRRKGIPLFAISTFQGPSFWMLGTTIAVAVLYIAKRQYPHTLAYKKGVIIHRGPKPTRINIPDVTKVSVDNSGYILSIKSMKNTIVVDKNLFRSYKSFDEFFAFFAQEIKGMDIKIGDNSNYKLLINQIGKNRT